ncbi:flagellar biosynthesis protein FliQ [Pelobacter seleniigenes]|uniref:flagellar biosynthesis protein FliQ n=1 Tax=Pelobacter seleniigenes TaxID=407188 RepID=UPI0004A78187|nr:flagellar biosynthesis protein FliQ [Pelobacter seleniigenes]
MTPEYVVGIARQAIETTLMCAAPMLIVALVVGLIISIFQAATQINEQTMTFIPKIVGVFVTLLIFAPWILQKASLFIIEIFNQLPNVGR